MTHQRNVQSSSKQEDDPKRRQHADTSLQDAGFSVFSNDELSPASFRTASAVPTADSVLNMQRTQGNAAVRRHLLSETPFQENIMDAQPPAYLQSALSGKPADPSRYHAAIQRFHQAQPPGLLNRSLSGLAEAHSTITQSGPLNQIRRMGRAHRDDQNLPQPGELPGNDEMVTQVLTFFYPEIPPPAELNDPLRNLASVMLWQAIQASSQMDLVPRPAGSPPGLAWLAMETVKMVWRRSHAQGIYVAVRNTVALAHRTEYELAREGVGM